MKYEKRFKAYKFFFILSLYKQFICKHHVTQCIMYRTLLNFFSKNAALKTMVILLSTVFTRISAAAPIKSPQMWSLFEGGAYLSN